MNQKIYIVLLRSSPNTFKRVVYKHLVPTGLFAHIEVDVRPWA